MLKNRVIQNSIKPFTKGLNNNKNKEYVNKQNKYNIKISYNNGFKYKFVDLTASAYYKKDEFKGFKYVYSNFNKKRLKDEK